MGKKIGKQALYLAFWMGTTGLAAWAAPWTDDPLTSNTPIRVVHITELRAQINNLRAPWGLSAFSWTDNSLNANTRVRAVHLTELRQAILDVYNLASDPPPNPVFSDPVITPGMSPVRAAHFSQLRTAVDSAPVCGGDGAGCGSGCCSGLTCCGNGLCQTSCAPPCAPDGSGCSTGSNCCSGVCSGSFCVPAGGCGAFGLSDSPTARPQSLCLCGPCSCQTQPVPGLVCWEDCDCGSCDGVTDDNCRDTIIKCDGSPCCDCWDWVSLGCGQSPCAINERRQVRGCNDASCGEERCVADASCAPCYCWWQSNGCGCGGSPNNLEEIRVCDPPGCRPASTKCTPSPSCSPSYP
ncbi:MAG: hypothetical protein HY401_07535 [Elusimicrobia bacterium]|nr:hypothetical protein [Elusimicrobiota bacterium]